MNPEDFRKEAHISVETLLGALDQMAKDYERSEPDLAAVFRSRARQLRSETDHVPDIFRE